MTQVEAGPQGAGDNVYQVTVVASDGELDVSVTVTDVDEPGRGDVHTATAAGYAWPGGQGSW